MKRTITEGKNMQVVQQHLLQDKIKYNKHTKVEENLKTIP